MPDNLGATQLEKYILYADDDKEDQDMFAETLKEIAADVSVLFVSDGDSVRDFLYELQPGSILPCLILLDMNMPKLNGVDTLKRLKSSSVFNKVPVILFSTSVDPINQENALSLGAIEFVRKPVKYSEFGQVVLRFVDHCEMVPPRTEELKTTMKSIIEYWTMCYSPNTFQHH